MTIVRSDDDPHSAPAHTGYWRTNLSLVTALLAVWFVVSYMLSIVWVEPLNAFKLGGFPLGFWFAQQGSILVFVVLVFVYCVAMDRLDAQWTEPGQRETEERS